MENLNKELLSLKDKLEGEILERQNKVNAINMLLEEYLIEDFVLPEKWVILRTKENYEVVNNWFKEKGYEDPYLDSDYIWKDKEIVGYNSSVKLPKDYTEITFEQFNKYVLNK